MSGPALKQLHSHASIHDAALNEAEELTQILRQCLEQKESEKALEIACVAVEHWESRTLRHAEAEEEGLYKEISDAKPELKETIIALTRDHNLMRNLVREIKVMLDQDGVGDGILQRFQALILVDLLHNQDELKMIGEELGYRGSENGV